MFIDIQNKRKPAVVEAIENIDNNRYQVFFSPAHIEEIAALKMHHNQGDDKVNALLDLLDRITKSKSLLPFKRRDTIQVKLSGIYVSDENPKTTYSRVISEYSRNHIAENHQKEKIANGENFERKFQVTSKETNFIDIQREIDLIKPRLHQIIIEKYQSLPPIFSEYLPTQAPTCQEINFEYLGMFFPLHEITIEKIFEFLELRRYFPDKSTQFLSGLHDTTHAIYAAYCDVLVTNDKKLRHKTAAAYKWLGINTLIITPDELIDYLAN